MARLDSASTRLRARCTLTAAILLATLPLCGAALAADVWSQFRGPDGQGRADDADLPLTWSEESGVEWKTPLPGRGWSSPVVAGGRIWVTTAEERTPTEAERAALLAAASETAVADQMKVAAEVKLSAVEIDLATGKVLKQVELFTLDEPPAIHGLNSYASPTPVLADGRLVCHFGAMGTACVDTSTYEVLWRERLEIDHIVGPGSSPVVHQGRVIIPCDGGDKQFVEALELETGKSAWRRDRPPIRIENPDLRKAYCTPLVIEVGGRQQAIIPGAQWFIAYDANTGEEIWRLDHGSGFSNVPRPLFDGAMLYLNTGFTKAQLWAVRADGAGEIGDDHVAWRQAQQMPTMPSPVISEGKIFSISDGGVATCLDAKTGEVVWRERVPGQYSASALLGAGRVYFCSHEGRTTVVRASDQFEVLAENQLDGQLMSSPAAVDGDLILRTQSHLYRINKKSQPAPWR